ncbi:hypothetical protein HS99_0005905 [Kitasatospora aureofaciens]|uniref:Uncharacterized protein n=2 Tax=Kitasatospora aureofaciens TaxID=1894 RepID=A0A1E7N9F6_KITAU|nr:hypothetical protein [Kitasatospora aureofaciens]OEV37321.1 hypothetical protein HS99_0005905 [Kitasatospora aureofaciens]
MARWFGFTGARALRSFFELRGSGTEGDIMRPEFVTVMGTGYVARSVADRLADAGLTPSNPPTGGAHVLVTGFAVAEPSPHIFEETRRVLAAMTPGSWWIDMTHPPLRTDDLWVPPEDLARVTRVRVPVTDVRGVLVASPPVDLDLRSRQVCGAILRVADLVLPTQTPEFPAARHNDLVWLGRRGPWGKGTAGGTGARGAVRRVGCCCGAWLPCWGWRSWCSASSATTMPTTRAGPTSTHLSAMPGRTGRHRWTACGPRAAG